MTGPPDDVVARIGGRPAITSREFNARLTEFPIGDSGQGVYEARISVVNQMVDAKLIVLEARRRRGEADPHADDRAITLAEERDLGVGVIRESVANPMLLSNAEAQAYFEEHREAFPQVRSADLSEPEHVLFVKFTILSKRFQERLEDWRSDAGVEIDDNLLRQEIQ
jgi:hypothetical protein